MHWPTVIITVFGFWLVLTIVKQFTTSPKLGVAAQELAGYLLPRWRLFTADLKRLDVYIYIRDLHDDGTVGNWRDVTPVGREGSVRFTYTDRRLMDGFFRVAQRLALSMPAAAPKLVDLDEPRVWMVNRKYRMLLHYAQSQDGSANAEYRQFLLAVPPDNGDIECTHPLVPGFTVPGRRPRLLSPFHSFEPPKKSSIPVDSEVRKPATPHPSASFAVV